MRKIHLILIFLVLSNLSFAGIEDWLVSLRGAPIASRMWQPTIQPIQIGSTLHIQDQWFPTILANPYVFGNSANWDNTFRINNCTSEVTLRYDDALRECRGSCIRWTLEVDYTLVTYDSLNSATTNSSQSLTISYDPASNNTYMDKNMNQYRGSLAANLTITNVKYNEWNCGTQTVTNATTIPSSLGDVYLDLEQVTERYYFLNTSSYVNVSQEIPNSNNTLRIAWDYLQGAESYDVEWVFVDIPQGTISTDPTVWSFSNATRINTTNQYYDIPLGVPRGRIIYRVRGVGRDPLIQSAVVTVLGNFDYYPSVGTTVAGVAANTSSAYYYYDIPYGLDGVYNWQYSSSFAEDGKRKEVLNVFDGSLRNRQTVTAMNTDYSVLVAESKYDFQGRAAVKILPGVIDPGSADGVQFYLSYNRNYVAGNFDDSITYNSPNALSSTGGAGQYYSTSNTITDGAKAYTPDAAGYPFSQTSYLNDGTHRIRKQSGVGPNQKFGSGHETRYFYGTPTGQEELDRLFGSEAGYVSHYKKNLVEDANGQVSISYLDQEGRVIATALTCNNSDNLLSIDGAPAAVSFTSTLLGNNQVDQNGNSVSTSSILVTCPGTYTFHYALDPNVFSECGITPSNTGHDCVYDLQLSITDPDGNILPAPSGSTSLTTNPVLDTGITQLSTYTFTYTFSDIGNYTITKILRPSQSIINSLTAMYLANQTCVAAVTAAPQPCAVDCQTACFNTYFSHLSGTDSIYVDASGNAIPYANNSSVAWPLITACRQSACGSYTQNLDPCQMAYKLMLDDMSPGGQYFNNLPSEYVVTSGVQYQNPNYSTFSSGYSSQFINGWDTVHIPNSVITSFSSTFHSWNDVRLHWRPSMADTLVIYHPEYCTWNFYCGPKLCSTNDLGVHTWAAPYDSVYNFDSQMLLANPANHTDNSFFNPLLVPLSAIDSVHTGATSTLHDYSKYMPSYLNYSAHSWKDPFFSCSFPVCTSGSPADAETIVQDLLTRFIAVKDNYGTPITLSGGAQQYYSIWYVLDDPDNINAGCATLDANIVSYFQAMHNTIYGTGGYPTPAPTKYDIFRSIYKGLKHLVEVNAYKLYYTGTAPYGSGVGGCISGEDTRYSNGYLTLNVPGGSAAVTGDVTPDGFMVRFPEDKLTTGITLCGADTMCYQTVMGPVSTIPGSLSTYMSPTSPPQATAYSQTQCIISAFNDFVYNTGIDPTVSPDNVPATYYTDLAADMNALGLYPSVTVTPLEISHWMWQAGLTSPSLDTMLTMPAQFTNNCTSTMPNPSATFLDSLLSQCQTENQNLANNNANGLFQTNLQNGLNSFIADYLSACTNSLSTREHFSVDYTLNEYHYTLYYYDQAGNLVKTVPPDGVVTLTASTTPTLAAVATYRTAHPDYSYLPVVVPPHTMVTHYWYNSLQQLTKQYTPDGDSAWFWYDKIGRLVLSQTRRQQNEHNYASGAAPAYCYTTFDNLSRVIEVGKLESSTPMDYATSRETVTPGALSAWLSAANSTRREVTSTYYDVPYSSTVNGYFGSSGQQNLIGRIATVAYWTNPSAVTYDNAIHYSYDIHGGTQTVLKENNNANLNIAGLGALKRIDYDYDRISGNVNTMYYQRGMPDEFDHKYEYDADNRVTKAYSSRNGVIWEKEAKYFFYPHGPLARKEVGDKEVQGVDYAYTIQGWLKGANSSTIVSTRDMGYDGESVIPNSGGLNNLDYTFAKDIFGFSIDYFSGDFSSIKSFTSGYSFQPTISGTCSLAVATKDLFNGNISRMVTALTDNSLNQLPVQARAFRYDQLNRIKQSNAFVDANVISTDNWNTTSDDGTFKEYFAYDFNGNIQRAKRQGSSTGTLVMDSLGYNYSSPTTNNKLDNIFNAVSTSGTYGSNTLSSQSSGNYVYDESGRLIHDDQEEIDSVKWTAYGKVAQIIRKSSSSRSDIEFVYDANKDRIVKIVKPRSGGALTTQLNWVYTYYDRDGKGNVLATYKRTFATHSGGGYEDHYKLAEHDVYGATHIGIRDGNSNDDYVSLFSASIGSGAGAMFTGISYGSGYIWGTPSNFTRTIGYKEYEASNQLGNVLEVFSDKRIPTCGTGGSSTVVAYYQPAVLSATDYYAFGGEMPGRTFSGGNSQYGFNGKRFDPETFNSPGTEYDFGARIYNPRAARFMSIDPLAHKFPMLTPYQYASNTPLASIDLDGEEGLWNMLAQFRQSMVPPTRATTTVLNAPVDHPIITQRFDAVNNTPTGIHGGIDYAAANGTDVHATADGTVVRASTSSSYGNVVIIQHNLNTYTLYAHNSSLNVNAGTTVHAGDVIASSGNTGHVTGSGGGYHVHYEVIGTGANINTDASFYNWDNKVDPSLLANRLGATNRSLADRVALAAGGAVNGALTESNEAALKKWDNAIKKAKEVYKQADKVIKETDEFIKEVEAVQTSEDVDKFFNKTEKPK
jgi:RHS repeat-associated protein